MQRLPVIIRLLTLLGALLLVSCIDGREEYWIHADGSGRAEFTYSIPAAAARFQGGAAGVDKMLAEFLTNTPAITTSSHQVTELDGRLTVHLATAFDSVLELRNISSGGSMKKLPLAASGLTGDIKLDFVGRQVHASRVISAAKALPGSSILPASRFAGHQLSYIFHLPLAATASNATRSEDNGRTLVWDFPLAEAVRAPVSLRFEAPVPIPMALLIGGIGILVLLMTAGFIFIRHRRRKSTRR
jgi:hypothetical protein